MRTRVQWRSPVDSDFSDGRGRPGGDGRRHAFGVSAAELVADRSELALLKFTDGEAAPPLGGPDEGRVRWVRGPAASSYLCSNMVCQVRRAA
jgi:hypothetical protein